METKELVRPSVANQLTDEQFVYLQDLVYRKMGIRLTPIKKMMVQNRLGRYIRRSSDVNDLATLIRIVRKDESGIVAQSVYDAISTNHTFFFREVNHFKYLSIELLPGLIEECKKEHRPLRIWSAACSTGEEVYSLAITVEELKRLYAIGDLQYEIIGSDISQTVLGVANQGIYPAEVLKGFHYSIKKRYFQQGTGSFHDKVRVKEELRSNIRFIRHNLIEPLSLAESESFDIVFCRNVMIYFDAQSKNKLLDNVQNVMRPESYLFIGHSESLYNSTQDFELVNPTVYRHIGKIT